MHARQVLYNWAKFPAIKFLRYSQEVAQASLKFLFVILLHLSAGVVELCHCAHLCLPLMHEHCWGLKFHSIGKQNTQLLEILITRTISSFWLGTSTLLISLSTLDSYTLILVHGQRKSFLTKAERITSLYVEAQILRKHWENINILLTIMVCFNINLLQIRVIH